MKHYALSTIFLCTVASLYAVRQHSSDALRDWHNGKRHFVIVTATYNNASWYKQNLDSILSQEYDNYHVLITDDASTDGTPDLITQRIQELNAQDRVTLLRNTARRGAIANQHTMICSHCNATDIIVIVDGDDWLIDSRVLSYLADIYSDPNIWLTYGQFIEYPTGAHGFCRDMPIGIIYANEFRRFDDIPSHLRTFYAGLFHKIKYADLCERDGKPLRMCADIAAMFPMIEMARNGHFKFIPKPLLIYNAANNLNDYKISKSLQRSLDLDVRSRPRYSALATLF